MMPVEAARRPYRSPGREAQARATRHRVVRAATALFAARGYAGTTVAAVAARAKVSVPTIESVFGTKSRLLKAAIDAAIAGDDEPVPMLERDWASAAQRTRDPGELLSIVASVLAPAQARSSGLVLTVFEGARSDPQLAEVATQMSAQRAAMAGWLVARLGDLGALDPGISEQVAIDTVFALMEPALFDRLTRRRGWTLSQYQSWVVRSLRRLLLANRTAVLT